MKFNREYLPECPIATTILLIGSKWKLLIIRNLTLRTWRFNELKNSLYGISQKVLTQNLKELELDGIITRTVYSQIPPKVEYELTLLGLELVPMIRTMETWGNRFKQLQQIDF